MSAGHPPLSLPSLINLAGLRFLWPSSPRLLLRRLTLPCRRRRSRFPAHTGPGAPRLLLQVVSRTIRDLATAFSTCFSVAFSILSSVTAPVDFLHVFSISSYQLKFV